MVAQTCQEQVGKAPPWALPFGPRSTIFVDRGASEKWYRDVPPTELRTHADPNRFVTRASPRGRRSSRACHVSIRATARARPGLRAEQDNEALKGACKTILKLIVGEPQMLEALLAMARVLDEPLADASIVPTHLLSRFARRHVKVALGGEGGVPRSGREVGGHGARPHRPGIRFGAGPTRDRSSGARSRPAAAAAARVSAA